ncbi:MAG: ABC transporter substrate-binding protein [Thermomicrobiales bacterium]
MTERNEIHELFSGVLSGRVNRRQLLERAASLGIAVPGVLLMRASGASAQDATPIANVATPTEGDATPAATGGAAPKAGGSLRAIVVADPDSLDIHVTQLAQVRNMMESIYDTLTYLDAADPTFAIKGRLSSGWTFTEPPKLDFKLQPGVKFHNGEDFTADDVKFTIEYVKNPATNSPNVSVLTTVASVEVLDPLTARFNLTQPWPALPADLTMIQIYCKTATKESITTKPNGTGPFTWKEWIPGDHVTIAKNPAYWMPGLPYLDEIVFRPIKEKSTSLSVMEAGDADVFFTPELKDKKTIDGDAKLASIPSLLNDSGYVMYVNHNRAPMNDQNVRLAVMYAIDRQTYFDAFLAGQGVKNTSPWSKKNWAYSSINDTAFEYDLGKAKTYLEAACYKDGKKDGTQLAINIVYPKGYPEWKQGSEMFQAAMGELGVDVKVEELEVATWIDRIVKTDEHDLSWDYHFQRAVDPAWTLSLAFFYPPGAQNISRLKDDTLTDLIAKGGSELDQAKRKEYYAQFQARWNEIGAGVIVGEFLLYHAVAATVRGFATHPLFFQDFRTVWLDR